MVTNLIKIIRKFDFLIPVLIAIIIAYNFFIKREFYRCSKSSGFCPNEAILMALVIFFIGLLIARIRYIYCNKSHDKKAIIKKDNDELIKVKRNELESANIFLYMANVRTDFFVGLLWMLIFFIALFCISFVTNLLNHNYLYAILSIEILSCCTVLFAMIFILSKNRYNINRNIVKRIVPLSIVLTSFLLLSFFLNILLTKHQF